MFTFIDMRAMCGQREQKRKQREYLRKQSDKDFIARTQVKKESSALQDHPIKIMNNQNNENFFTCFVGASFGAFAALFLFAYHQEINRIINSDTF